MYKSKLQEYCQKKGWNLPEYSTVKEGFDHCPQFKATVIINGSTFSTIDASKSSKDAQNMVAQLAFENLTGFSSANNTLQGIPTPCVQQSTLNAALQEVSPREANTPIRETFKEMAHIYKNQLQIYAQKRNLLLPTYSSERDGPPHACRFKSKVTLEEKIYECTEYFSTLKDAENASAKVALMELSPDGIQEEDPGIFKNLLQELAQKEYSFLPEYNTIWSGTSHMPMFVSTVEINEESFTGQQAKTKKMAEMNVAKVSYTALKQRKMKQKIETFSPGLHVNDAFHSSFSKLQSILTAETSLGNSPNLNLSCNKGAYQKAADSNTITTSFNDTLVSYGENSQCSHNVHVESPSILKQNPNLESWEDSPTRKKVKVYPWMPNMTFPRGIAVLHKDEKWVAVTPQIQSSQWKE